MRPIAPRTEPRRKPQPRRADWRVDRARYLKETGRLAELRAEGLEDYLEQKGAAA